MSVFENKTKELIKVSVENTTPKEWKTVKPGQTIKTEKYGNYYQKAGLSLIGKPIEVPVVKEEKKAEPEKTQTSAEKRAAARKAREENKK